MAIMIKFKSSNPFSFLIFIFFISFFIKANQKALNKIEYISSLNLIDKKIVIVAKDGIHFYEKDFKKEVINKKYL